MNFLVPLAFSLASLLPIIVALYFLKLRRQIQRVSSTYLWRKLVRDTAANVPWQRLRPNLLLLLQLLALIALILALARPFTWSDAAAGSHLILVIDSSASMGATDVSPTRLGAAAAQARRLVESLPAGASARLTLIEAGEQVRVPVSGATEPGAALAALAALRPGLGGADFESALTLAAAIAAREPDSEVVILSDGRVSVPQDVTLPGRVRYIPTGSGSDNQAISVFSLQAGSGGRELTAFVQAQNLGTETVQRRLVLYADGQLLAARDLALVPGKAQAVTIPALPPDASAFEAHLEGADMLAADDHAWAVPPAAGKTAVEVLGPGNRFLETALGLMPNVELTSGKRPTTDDEAGTLPEGQNFQPSLTIFDTLVPTGSLPAGALLFIAPPRSTALFSVTGRLDAPQPVAVLADDPLLRYVDLRDVAVQDAARLPLPAWGRAVIVDRQTNAPLLVVGEQGGRGVGILAFDLRRSDLPLRVAFPLLLAILLDELVPGGASGIPYTVEPGQPAVIPAPPQASALTVRTPAGQTHALSPSDGKVLFDQTNMPGVYEVAWQDEAGSAQVLGRFAVNVASASESDITPRETLLLAGAGSPGEETLPRGRREWWRTLAWIALGVLVAEWMVANRGRLIVNY
ncbi:MAG: VWA domain-containing protein [Thermoflexales bacterium]|nr:VWA domain-containing protein [Thermoflexales bacterium]